MTDVPEGSADPVIAALSHVLRDYGRRITTDPVRLRAALNDVLGPTAQQHRAAVDALVVSAHEDIPSTLDEGGADSTTAAADRLAAWGLDQPTAAWVAGAWLAVLPGHSPVLGTPTAAPLPAAPPTSLPPTLAPGGTAQPPTMQPAGDGAASVAAPSLLTRATRKRGLTAAAAAALLVVVAGTAYAITSGKGQPLAGPSGTPTPWLTSSGGSLQPTPGTGPSGDAGTPSPSVSVSVQATILSSPTPAGTKQPAATRTPARTPTVKPKPKPAPAPRPVAATTGVVHSVAQQTTSSVWNSSVWHASIAPYIKNPWSRMTFKEYLVYSPYRHSYVTGSLWAQVQKYGTDGFAWHPLANGPMTIYIHFYVYNSAGLQSNEGMLTVNIACQTTATVGCSQ